MVIQEFSYFAPKSIEEACSLLQKHGDDAKALAGGQSLIPLMKLNLIQTRYVIDLKRIPGMSYIRKENLELEIGALTKHCEIANSPIIREFAPLLADTAAGIGHPLIRNRGTIGGSLCHCDPAADYGPTMLVLESEMTVVSMGGSRREIPTGDFFVGPFETALKKGEILEKVTMPIFSREKRIGYSVKKLTLGHGDFPLLNVSVLASYDKKAAKFRSVAIALGGVSEKPFRVTAAEKLLMGSENPGVQDFEEAAKIAKEKSNPKSDIDVSASYKKRMVGVFTQRALVEAFERSRSLV